MKINYTAKTNNSCKIFTAVLQNYRKLETKPLTTTIDINKYQYYVYDNIAEYLEGKSNLQCNGTSALKTAQILDQIQQKLN